MLDEVDMIDQNGMGNGEIHTAATAGDLTRLKRLLDADPLLVEANGWFGTKPLHYAARSGNLECVKLLVERGAEVNTKCIVNKTTPIFEASTAEVARYLVDRGAMLNVVSSSSRVPLDYALQGKHVEVVNYLISCGVDVNYQPSGSSYSMLEWAITDNRNPDKTEIIVKILLEAGANPNQRNKRGGTTFLHRAVGIQWLVKLLLSYGADPCIRDAWGQSCFDLTDKAYILELFEPYRANLKVFHKQQDDFARLIQRLIHAGIVRREEFVPCSEEEVNKLEQEHGVKLPREYRKFLRFMGISAGIFLVSDHWSAFLESFDDFLGKHFFELDEVDGEPPEWLMKMPKNFFVFASRMGDYNLGFFADGATDDPEIYRIDYYGKMQKAYDSLWEFIQEMVEYYEYYRDPEGFTQRSINAQSIDR
jgi:ankyrin repeat protein